MTNTTEQALRDAPSIPASKLPGGLYTTRDVERMHLAWLNYFNEFRIADALSLPPSEQEPVAQMRDVPSMPMPTLPVNIYTIRDVEHLHLGRRQPSGTLQPATKAKE